jgi:ankyrin repeat protein
MKSLLVSIVAAVVLVGCGPSESINEAAAFGNIEAVKQHLAADANVNAKDDLRYTPLHVAAQQGHDRCKEIVELLIAAGADVNVKDGQGGLTPLHTAIGNGNKEIVELLIANSADVNAKTESGWTPLHEAAGGAGARHKQPHEQHKEIVQMLIAAGADVNAKTKHGTRVLDKANDREIAALLRKHGARY